MPNFNKLTAEIVDALKFAPRLYLCGRCSGEGEQRSLCQHEEERDIADTCYHCANGLVDEETHLEDVRKAAVERIAYARIQLEVNLADAPEEEGGYDFGLAAAESGVSFRDYLVERAWAAEADVAAILESLTPAVRAAVLEVF